MFEQLFHIVGGLEYDVHHFRSYGKLSFSRFVQHIFHIMGKSGQHIEIEKRAGAFDRMRYPENTIEQIQIVRRILQLY